jgi:hypothetical protein
VLDWSPNQGVLPTKCLWIEKSVKKGQGSIRTLEAS